MAEANPLDDLTELEQDLEQGQGDSQQDTSRKLRRSELSWQDKLQEAKLLKQAGNDFYKSKNLRSAVGKYHRSLLYLRGITKSLEDDVPYGPNREKPDIPDDAQEEVNQLVVQCYNNLAACLLQPEKPNYTKVLQYCDKVLEIMPNNVKTLYRKGVAMYQLKCPEEALETLTHAMKLPDGQKDSNIRKYVQLCEQAVIKQDQLMKERYKAMFASS